MERHLREVTSNQLTLISPPLLIPEFLIYLLIKPMFGVFILAMKFDCLFLGIFLKFSLICDFNFWQISPLPWIYVSKDALNHFLVNSSAKKNISLKRAKNVVFSLFCILVDRPIEFQANKFQNFKQINSPDPEYQKFETISIAMIKVVK